MDKLKKIKILLILTCSLELAIIGIALFLNQRQREIDHLALDLWNRGKLIVP